MSTKKRHKRGRKRKLEMDERFDDLSSDDNHNHNTNNGSPSKKRVKFDENVNEDSSTNKYNKYELSSIDFPKLSNYLKVRVGDNEELEDIDNNNNNNKELWLFHFPPGFDESSINNLKISIPKHPKIGSIICSFRIGKHRYQIIEYDCSQNNIVNLFPIHYKLKVGKPFKRHFHILPDLRPSPNKQKKIKYKINAKQQNDDDILFKDDIHQNDIDKIKMENIQQNENENNEIHQINEVNEVNEINQINQINQETKSKKKKKKKKKSKKSLSPSHKNGINIQSENGEHIKIEKKENNNNNNNCFISTEISTSNKKSKKKKDKKQKKSKKKKDTSSIDNDNTCSISLEASTPNKISKKISKKKHKKHSNKKKKDKSATDSSITSEILTPTKKSKKKDKKHSSKKKKKSKKKNVEQ